jgi:hypothetical protein
MALSGVGGLHHAYTIRTLPANAGDDLTQLSFRHAGNMASGSRGKRGGKLPGVARPPIRASLPGDSGERFAMPNIALAIVEQPKAVAPKPYRKPTFTKGPLLAKVTAADSQVSGAIIN